MSTFKMPMLPEKGRVVRAHYPDQENNHHPAVVLQSGRGVVHVVTGTSHPSADDFKSGPKFILVKATDPEYGVMGLTKRTYFFAHHYAVLTSRQFEPWRGGSFQASGEFLRRLLRLVQGQVPKTVRRVLPASALTFTPFASLAADED